MRTPHGKYTIQINPASGVDSDDLNYFKFIGRFLALAIFHRRFLDVHFDVSFYKIILKELAIADLKSVDAELYRGPVWMLVNDITDFIDETFTEENKRDYVDVIVKYRIYGSTRNQFQSFMASFTELIPRYLIGTFDERKLDLLICGVSEIDVHEVRDGRKVGEEKASKAAFYYAWEDEDHP